jgi:hypothetical protein
MATTREPLPISEAAFKELADAARDRKTRAELVARCIEEFDRAGGHEKATPNALRLFESRLFEFLRWPRSGSNPSPSGAPTFAQLEFGFNHVWPELGYLQSERFALWLETLLAGPDRTLAHEAVTHIARAGLDRSLPLLCQLASGDDLSMARAAVAGAGVAAFRGVASERFRERMFKAVRPLVDGSRDPGSSGDASKLVDSAVGTLLFLDEKGAVALMCSPACIWPGNPALRKVVLTIEGCRDNPSTRREARVSADLLWPIYDAARQGTLRPGHPKGHAQLAGAILTLTADCDPERTRRECREAMKTTGEGWNWLREGAAKALKRCKQIPEPGAVLAWVDRRPGKLGGDAEDVIRAYELAEHVIQDGLKLYFHNIGRHWKSALAGLTTMKLEKAAGTLSQAASVFGPTGPPATDRARRAACESLDEEAAAKLEKLDGAFEALAPSVLARVEKYIARHPGAFAKAAT